MASVGGQRRSVGVALDGIAAGGPAGDHLASVSVADGGDRLRPCARIHSATAAPRTWASNTPLTPYPGVLKLPGKSSPTERTDPSREADTICWSPKLRLTWTTTASRLVARASAGLMAAAPFEAGHRADDDAGDDSGRDGDSGREALSSQGAKASQYAVHPTRYTPLPPSTVTSRR